MSRVGLFIVIFFENFVYQVFFVTMQTSCIIQTYFCIKVFQAPAYAVLNALSSCLIDNIQSASLFSLVWL